AEFCSWAPAFAGTSGETFACLSFRCDCQTAVAEVRASAIAPVFCGAGAPDFLLPRAFYLRELGKPKARPQGGGAPKGAAVYVVPRAWLRAGASRRATAAISVPGAAFPGVRLFFCRPFGPQAHRLDGCRGGQTPKAACPAKLLAEGSYCPTRGVPGPPGRGV